jgi:hypothetical protein
MEKVVKYSSIIQSGRPREFVGSNAQMYKGLFKFLGPRALDAFMPFLKSGMYTYPRAYVHVCEFVCGVAFGFKSLRGHWMNLCRF